MTYSRQAARTELWRTAVHGARPIRGGTSTSSSKNAAKDDYQLSVGDRAPEQWRTQGWDHPWALRRSMDGDWVKECLPTTWGRFFPDVPEAERDLSVYGPCGPDFWRLYAEPVEDFLRAAATLYEILDGFRTQTTGKTKPRHPANSTASPADDAQSTHRAVANLDLLFNSIHPCLHVEADGSFQMQWNSASLFGALTMMAVQDMLGGQKMSVCGNANCERLFIAEAYQARFCSDRCRYAVQKRTYRGRVKTRAEKSASKRRRRVTTSRSRSPRPQPPKRP